MYMIQHELLAAQRDAAATDEWMNGLASAQPAQPINLYPCHYLMPLHIALLRTYSLNHQLYPPSPHFGLRPHRLATREPVWCVCVCACVRAQSGPALSQQHGSVQPSSAPPPQLFFSPPPRPSSRLPSLPLFCLPPPP
ncbi:hypothetical protein LX36DRAFT_208635 [Colletotrichum falcatum]|nr:hypothetical protein LX36DRAFT_208635 [Colletotrichum falcatum]